MPGSWKTSGWLENSWVRSGIEHGAGSMEQGVKEGEGEG